MTHAQAVTVVSLLFGAIDLLVAGAAAVGAAFLTAAILRRRYVTNPQLQQAIDRMTQDVAAFHTAQAALLTTIQAQVTGLRQTVTDTLNRVPDPAEQASVLSAFSTVSQALEEATANANAAAAAAAAGQDITQAAASTTPATTQTSTQAPAPTDASAAGADLGSSTGGTPAGEGSADAGVTGDASTPTA